MQLPFRRLKFAVLSLAVAAGTSVLGTAGSTASGAAADVCGQYQTVPVANGRYIVDNNNYGGAAECVRPYGSSGFTVTRSDAAGAPPAGPVAYPEIFEGCHWHTCTTGTALPIQVSKIGSAKSSWSTSKAPGTSGNYNVAYDLWFNSTPATDASGQPDGAELMIWLDRQPPEDAPPGNVAYVNGTAFVAWQTSISANGKTWPLIGYRLQDPAASVTNLDLRSFVRDAVTRGAVSPSSYLIAVEAGFEIWNGGQGLTTNSFSSTSASGYPVGQVRAGAPGVCATNSNGNALTPGNPVTVEACGSAAAQRWTASIDGTIRHGGMCVGTSGASVVLDTCNGTPWQVWLPSGSGGLWNAGSGLCLRDPSEAGVPGTGLDLVNCDGSRQSQVWTLPSTVSANQA
ncbi:GH12 family glycosyl hydrolase domain-containing protein [Yinghuangia seranimata]|uniref:GH12 family glycosyl hydrolase domain-containing protein n=1 Tax=Yinghuangia seranimata TaxID=408067 RepID=UPI00248AE9F6|nr:ricin-type beta-trefoil lectin domain protein [Yinghuangia seranimata]MDI2128208.1 ricin-type beta-trefoil lectin domain protein [Yinghuangia seranimata]